MDNRIQHDTCDACGETGTGVLYHADGSPVMFTCRTCDPAVYERTARRQIDTWLEGGTATTSLVIPRGYV